MVASKRVRRKEAKKRMATDVRETAKKGGRTAAPTPLAGR
jgi:predicted metal-dependent RNase